MKASVQMKDKKGRWSVIAPSWLAPNDLQPLAAELREIPGVKRALARAHSIYLRVNVTAKNLRRRIHKTVQRFFAKLTASPQRTSHPLRLSQAKRNRRRVAQRRHRRRERQQWHNDIALVS